MQLFLSNFKPIPCLCICFCLGIVFGRLTSISLTPLFYFLAALSFLFSIVCLKKEGVGGIFIFLLCFFLGASAFKSSQLLPNCHIYHLISAGTKFISLRGTVISDPEMSSGRSSFIFKAEELLQNERQYKLCGKVKVSVFGKNKFSYGEELILSGRLYEPRFKISSRLRYREYLKQERIYVLLSVQKKNKIVFLRKKLLNPLVSFSFGLKHKAQEIIRRYISDIPASILAAMLLGERRQVPPFINQAMIYTGTVHILVVSGFNVGIVAFVLLLFFKIIRIPRRIRYIITIFGLIIYCLLTGASVPVVRATLMAVVILAGYLLRRQADIYNSLFLAAIIILVYNPLQLFNIGFQLSFASVLAIVWLYPKIYASFPEKLRKIKVINWLIQLFSVSLSAWLGTAGFVAYYFQIFSSIGIFANMFIAPLASLITACGLSLILISIIIPFWAFLFARAAEFLVIILIKMNLFFVNIPRAYFKIPSFKFIYLFLGYSAFILIVFLYWRWYNNFLKNRPGCNYF
ncbi:MAG: ComEC family competence protein [Candidatus Omnitrophica bacterium]|nr:ComEC family competence protein [Candidatus Omnitrophota bacterium]